MHYNEARSEGTTLQPASSRRPIAAALVLACAGLLMASFAMAAPPKSAKPSKATEIHIGAIVPESWPNAAQGQDIRNGMQLALQTWPGQAPVPTLVVKDSGCNPHRAALAAQSLIEAKVDIVLGGWCVVGSVPVLLKSAGLLFVSSNAERYAADGSVQFARLNANVADGIAARLRTEAGLRVTANSVCWIDFEPRVSDKYDAALCPVLSVDKARWYDVAPAYTAAFKKPFTLSAARGYAAMEIALAYVTRLRAGAKPAAAWADAQNIGTVLGRLPARDAASPDEAMQLIFGAKLPKLAAREAGAFDQMVKAKTCGCKTGATCAQNTWSTLPFVVEGIAGSCAQPVLTSSR
jgi:hypothetical protein